MAGKRPARKPAQAVAVPTMASAAAAKARAAGIATRKAAGNPAALTEADVRHLPGRTVLALGNAGKLRHLGVGTGKSGSKLAASPAQRAKDTKATGSSAQRAPRRARSGSK